MDGGRRLSSSCCSRDASAEVWHSTPVKKKNDGAPPDVGQASGLSSFRMDSAAQQWSGGSPDARRPPSLQETQFPVNDLSGSTIQRQRKELQLLMAELKDREQELNAMAASHQRQHQVWEQDRQRALSVEQRCARLDEELQKRNEVIRVLTERVWVVETREKEVQQELSEAQRQICELEKKQLHISEKCQDYEEKNQSLSSTVVALSTQIGSLQVREEELSSMLKLKDKDVTEASGHVLDLSGRLRDLETALKESRSQENKLLRDLEENKRRHKESRREVTQLREELQQQVTQSSSQREETIRLKQELQLLHRDLVLTAEGDSWKDELLDAARSKHQRITSELRCLRQVCETQQNQLQLLRLNQERKPGPGSFSSRDELTCNCVDHRSRTAHDPTTPPTADLKGSVNGDPGVFSSHLTDVEARLSSCSLQQLLDDCRSVVGGPESSVLSSSQSGGPPVNSATAEPLHFHQTTPHHHPSKHQNRETPPTACPRHGTGPGHGTSPRHGAIQPSMWTS